MLSRENTMSQFRFPIPIPITLIPSQSMCDWIARNKARPMRVVELHQDRGKPRFPSHATNCIGFAFDRDMRFCRLSIPAIAIGHFQMLDVDQAARERVRK